MKIKKTSSINVLNQDRNSIVAKLTDFIFSIKKYIFIYMAFYYLASFAIYYLKLPSFLNAIIESFAFFLMLAVIYSTYDSLTKIRSVNELKEQLSEFDNFSIERKVITESYYKDIKEIYEQRTKFDNYWYLALIFPAVLLLSFGWFDFPYTLYIAAIGINKHFLDNELESIRLMYSVTSSK